MLKSNRLFGLEFNTPWREAFRSERERKLPQQGSSIPQGEWIWPRNKWFMLWRGRIFLWSKWIAPKQEWIMLWNKRIIRKRGTITPKQETIIPRNNCVISSNNSENRFLWLV